MNLRPFLLACLALAATLFATPAASAAVTGDLDALDQIATLRDSQKNIIQTWQGTCTFTTTGQDPSDDRAKPFTQKLTTSFLLDRPADLRRWRTTITGDIDVVMPNGRLVHPPALVNQGLLQRDQFCWLSEDAPADDPRPRTLHVTFHDLGLHRQMPDNFDPFKYDTSATMNIGGFARMLHAHARDNKSPYVVARHGDLVTITMNSGTLINEFVVDLSKGATLVSQRLASPEGAQEYSYDYEQQGKAWVIKRWTLHHTASGGTGRTIQVGDQTAVFTSKVNARIDPAEFTLKALGLRRNDRIADDRNHTSHPYDPDADDADAPAF